MTVDPLSLVKPRRTIVGMAAVLLPFLDAGGVDWEGFERLLSRTLDAGLTPAVNMDTGYANLIDDATKREVLTRTKRLCERRAFIAGAFVKDQPGSTFDAGAYRRAMETVESFGGTAIVFPSYGLQSLDSSGLVGAFDRLGSWSRRFYAFELGDAFVPFGRIFSIEEFGRVLQIPSCVGAKHSSLNRVMEWERLALRDRTRPDFQLLTGNDLAIDMVMYGSDYLLGLAAFAPDLFSRRDRYWVEGDARFFELNDALQYLGAFAFRAPTPAYRHTAAMFLKLRGWIDCDDTHPGSQRRPDSDRAILAGILDRLQALKP